MILVGACLATLCPNVGGATITAPEISEQACPVERMDIRGADGHTVTAFGRRPPGEGPFPAVIFLHGGLVPYEFDVLQKELLHRVTYIRYLAAGYVTIAPTFRSREANPQSREPFEDCLAVIAFVKKMRGVDPKSVVLLGGSGGGSLALELAGETDVCAIAAGEPASVLFTGMMTAGMTQRDRAFQEMMKNPREHYTPALQTFTRAKVAKIHCPVFIGQGNVHPITIINEQIVMPELRAAGKELVNVVYPGQPHGFYFGGGEPVAAQKFFDDSSGFFLRYLSTKPKALSEQLITRVAARSDPETEPADAARKGERPAKRGNAGSHGGMLTAADQLSAVDQAVGGLDPERKARADEIYRKAEAQVRELRANAGSDRTGARAKAREVEDAAREQVRALLSTEQRQKFDAVFRQP